MKYSVVLLLLHVQIMVMCALRVLGPIFSLRVDYGIPGVCIMSAPDGIDGLQLVEKPL